MELFLVGIIVLLVADRAYADHQHRLSMDQMQNKLMARDFTEYSRPKQGGQVTNPLMQRIANNYKERGEQDG